ncbi:hypothetical protein [Burkholderia gladioli]|uniref:hypothetical protein n=1 Tax=Burkholderia gladioli TaxID=28095 RepID=UPI001641A512|nr:hypothetical protein [Burkholderia gladioli]
MTASTRTDPELLPDGAYWATCQERSALSVAASGHSPVFPQALMIVKGDWAHFYRDGEEVWTCNVRYAAANFVIQTR